MIFFFITGLVPRKVLQKLDNHRAFAVLYATILEQLTQFQTVHFLTPFTSCMRQSATVFDIYKKKLQDDGYNIETLRQA